MLKRKVIQCRATKNSKGAGTNGGESGARNLRLRLSEAEPRVRDSVKLKTVTEMRRRQCPWYI